MSVLVGTADGLFVDGLQEISGHRVRWLARGGGGWWAIAGKTLVRRDDGEWRQIASVEGLTCVQPVDRAAVAGTAGAHLVRVSTGELQPLPAFDDMPGRDEWHAVGSREPYVRSLTTTPGGVLLANVHVGGIPRSPDGGETWQPTIDVDADVHQVRAHPDRPELALAAAAVGVCRSDDAGATWSVSTEGLHATYCRAVALAGDVMFVSASTGPRRSRARSTGARSTAPARSNAASRGCRSGSRTTSTPAASTPTANTLPSAALMGSCTAPTTPAARGACSPRDYRR
jgi:hypothetical protein